MLTRAARVSRIGQQDPGRKRTAGLCPGRDSVGEETMPGPIPTALATHWRFEVDVNDGGRESQ